MYKLFRDVHLIAGLFGSVFLLAFGLSAIQMAYPIYSLQPTETVTTVEVPPQPATSPRDLARWLMDQRDLRGDLTEVTVENGSVILSIVRPGTTHRVEYDPRLHSARVTTRVLDAIGMLNRIHHIGGIRHDYWAINAWGWFLFVVSLSLLLLAITGVTMWFARHDDRRLGTIVLGAGLTWGLTLLILIRMG